MFSNSVEHVWHEFLAYGMNHEYVNTSGMYCPILFLLRSKLKSVRFQILTAAIMKMRAFWDIMLVVSE
jgi:hypothetical protein